MAAWHPWGELKRRPGVRLEWADVPGGAQVVNRGGQVTIYLDEALDRRERAEALTHELIHLERGLPPAGTPARARAGEERKVRRATLERLAPAETLAALESAGDTLELWEVAEILDLTEATARAAVELWRSQRHDPR